MSAQLRLTSRRPRHDRFAEIKAMMRSRLMAELRAIEWMIEALGGMAALSRYPPRYPTPKTTKGASLIRALNH